MSNQFPCPSVFSVVQKFVSIGVLRGFNPFRAFRVFRG